MSMTSLFGVILTGSVGAVDGHFVIGASFSLTSFSNEASSGLPEDAPPALALLLELLDELFELPHALRAAAAATATSRKATHLKRNINTSPIPLVSGRQRPCTAKPLQCIAEIASHCNYYPE
jgi:hypothetical protein